MVFDHHHQRWGQVADRLERGREACEARLEALEKQARFGPNITALLQDTSILSNVRAILTNYTTLPQD